MEQDKLDIYLSSARKGQAHISKQDSSAWTRLENAEYPPKSIEKQKYIACYSEKSDKGQKTSEITN